MYLWQTRASLVLTLAYELYVPYSLSSKMRKNEKYIERLTTASPFILPVFNKVSKKIKIFSFL